MLDLGVSKLALIGAIALVVIGPEKLPRVARTIGTLLGKAQRYVADVKQEVSRSMQIDELKKMKQYIEGAARDVENSMHAGASDFEKSWAQASSTAGSLNDGGPSFAAADVFPVYQHPKKHWRVKTSATPQWFKARAGVRSRAQSGAARVARFRPPAGRRA